MVAGQTQQLRLGEVLIESGDLTEEQLNDALDLQKSSPERKRLGEFLIDNGIITENRLNTALAQRLGIPYLPISECPIDLDAVAKIPKAVAQKFNLIAVSTDRNSMRLLISDPLNYYALEDVKLISHVHQLEIVICDRNEIVSAIQSSYSEIEAQKASRDANEAAGTTSAFTYVDLGETADDTPVVTLINSMLHKAHSAGASDIHIEPFEDHTQIRIRVDGQIVDYTKLSQSLHSSMTARIKILSSMDIAEKRAPQDGHFRAKLEDYELNVRVSSLPTIYGEKLVLRFLSQTTLLDHATTFGMEQDDYEKMLALLQSPHGVLYITGPTGSGKTTTLYMLVEFLSTRNVNIATIEDPVERTIVKVNQSQINPLAGLTFDSGLRSILRQDPDIIMIGETRDSETATISVRSALTGHFVLSSLHTNDAVSAIVRLLDMGVEDYLLANSLVGIVAQRLVKKICSFCREEYDATEADIRAMGGTVIERLARGKGCHNCNNTGYKGRVAIHEILTIDGNIRNMINGTAGVEEIYKYVAETGVMKTLQTSLLKLVRERVTSVEELLKLTYFVQ
ncbi:MAG: Flp pilus assembly complex ATPase component TadA [Oscillospiraceae bacterium]|jgi:type IV pilus assembly protein PilB|nr:Flp pilus assembly complex ATPase component TadA [Oscillospiraceae bacterium]